MVDLKSQIKLKLNASKSFQIVDVQNISEAMVVSEYHKARMSLVIQIVDAVTCYSDIPCIDMAQGLAAVPARIVGEKT